MSNYLFNELFPDR